MSFLSGNTSNLPQPEQKPLGMEAAKLSTHQQARPLPLIYGTQRVGVTFASSAFNVRTEAVRQKVGKKNQTVGYNYFCSFAALVCHGPVDRIKAIYFDGEKVWPSDPGDAGIERQSGEDYVPINLGAHGQWRFYWGTETQVIDPSLSRLSADATQNPQGLESPANTYEEHPAYRGQCYFVATNHFLGHNRTNVQNIEVVVARFPSIGWLGEAEFEDDCGIAHAIVEAMTNQRYGLGLGNEGANNRFDQGSIQEFADILRDEKLAVSVLVNRVQPWRSVLVHLLEYVDGFYTVTPSGKFSLRLVRKRSAGGCDYPTLDESCLIEAPEISVDMDESKSAVVVTFTDRATNYVESSTEARNGGAQALKDEADMLILSRPWVTRADVADRLALIASKQLSRVRPTGTLKVRQSRLQGIKAGDLFLLNYARYGLCGYLCLATEVTRDAYEPEVSIRFQEDRGALNQMTYEPTPVAPVERPLVKAEPIVFARALELPFDKAVGEVPTVHIFAARPSPLTTRFHVHLELVENSDYELIHTVESFAWHGYLEGNYAKSAAGEVTIYLDGPDLTLPSVSEKEGTANRYLALIGDELFSIYNTEALGDDRFRFQALRARFDTGAADHAAGAEVFIASLESIRGAAFRADDWPCEEGDVQRYKLQTVAVTSELPLDQAGAPIALTFTDRVRRPWPPRNLKVNNQAGTASYFSGEDFTVTWTVTNRLRGEGKVGLAFDENPIWVVELRLASAPEAPSPLLRKRYDSLVASAVLQNAEVQTALGGEVDFVLRLYADLKSFPSQIFEEVLVTKS